MAFCSNPVRVLIILIVRHTISQLSIYPIDSLYPSLYQFISLSSLLSVNFSLSLSLSLIEILQGGVSVRSSMGFFLIFLPTINQLVLLLSYPILFSCDITFFLFFVSSLRVSLKIEEYKTNPHIISNK